MYSPCYLFTYLSIYLFIYCQRAAAGGIFVPRPGTEPRLSVVKAYSPTHWPARGSPCYVNMSEETVAMLFFPP